MRVWPFNRRRRVQPIDRTGPATVYPHRLGALSPAAAGEAESRACSVAFWNEPTQILNPIRLTHGQRTGYRLPGDTQ
ncbi:hypothetical protein [Micromonospora nigra]|uniref:hypothetical protein n=1 Tax=Micromonospora nigra TaxID=145857 RepID=UPI001FE0D0BA|nr:hypothetical protein [Micromonospora nigra]